MKQRSIQILTFIALFASNAISATPVSDRINDAWMNGERRGIASIARTRAQRNPNDLASILIQFDYYRGFLQAKELEELIPQIRSQAEKISTPEFAKVKSQLLSKIKTV